MEIFAILLLALLLFIWGAQIAGIILDNADAKSKQIPSIPELHRGKWKIERNVTGEYRILFRHGLWVTPPNLRSPEDPDKTFLCPASFVTSDEATRFYASYRAEVKRQWDQATWRTVPLDPHLLKETEETEKLMKDILK